MTEAREMPLWLNNTWLGYIDVKKCRAKKAPFFFDLNHRPIYVDHFCSLTGLKRNTWRQSIRVEKPDGEIISALPLITLPDPLHSPLPAAKTWDPKNQACNAVYAICIAEARKGTLATKDSIIRNIKYSPALEMTSLKMVMRAIAKAIMDVYDDAGEIGATKGETENQCFNRVYVELTAMEEAKDYFENMAKF